MKKKAAIIGAGIAGLATAIRLRKLDYEVHVFERRASAGGKIDELEMQGFRFDMGPTVLTMPHLVDELFLLHGMDPTEHFRHKRLQQPVRYFFDDGTSVDAYADLAAYAKELEVKLGVKPRHFFRYVRDARRKFNLTHDVFLRSSLHRVSNYLRWKSVKGIALFHRVGVFRSMSRWNKKIFRNEKMEQIVNRYAQYNGSDPYRMPSTFNVIGHVELSRGVHVAEGGMRSVASSLFYLAEKLGVQFHFNSTVTSIDAGSGKLDTVNSTETYDVIVSNADIIFTQETLLKSKVKAEALKQREKSASAVLFYFGIKGVFPELNTHNFFFGKDDRMEFSHVFAHESVGDDFTIYLHVSSKYQTFDAPEGCENWFIMINTPNDIGQDWNAESARLREIVLDRLSEKLQTDLRSAIVCEHFETPGTMAEKYNSFRGAIYGDSSNDMLAAFLRHPNFSKKYHKLFFAGGSVHPGAGIPLCLYSAEITAKLIASRNQ